MLDRDSQFPILADVLWDLDKNYADAEQVSLEEFREGLLSLYKTQLLDAKLFFQRAIHSTDSYSVRYYEMMSFLGLVEVLLFKGNGGLMRCYEAAREFNDHAQLYLNIAYAEYVLGHRKRCVDAIYDALDHEPDNPLVISFFEFIGKRSKKNYKKNRTRNPLKRLLRRNRQIKQSTVFTQIIKWNVSLILDEQVEAYILQAGSLKRLKH